MQYEKILVVWVCLGSYHMRPEAERTQIINILRIAWEQRGGNEFIIQQTRLIKLK